MPKTYLSPDGIATKLETMGEFSARVEGTAARSWSRVNYYAADVPVSDDRGEIPGANVFIHRLGLRKDDSGQVIPPEGNGDPSCWLGDLATTEILDDPDLLDALESAAEKGARGESGAIE